MLYGVFVQAEVGVRELDVIGVEACALPVWGGGGGGCSRGWKKLESPRFCVVVPLSPPLSDMAMLENIREHEIMTFLLFLASLPSSLLVMGLR